MAERAMARRSARTPREYLVALERERSARTVIE
jgi:hypothetical protein